MSRTTNKIRWIKRGERNDPDSQGYWDSAEGRFDIAPNFRSTVSPDSYTVTDYMAYRQELKERGERAITRGHSAAFYTADTVRECKDWAEAQVAHGTRSWENVRRERERHKPPQPLTVLYDMPGRMGETFRFEYAEVTLEQLVQRWPTIQQYEPALVGKREGAAVLDDGEIVAWAASRRRAHELLYAVIAKCDMTDVERVSRTTLEEEIAEMAEA
jgi:hypothetical protein